jgi:hypothetical protein
VSPRFDCEPQLCTDAVRTGNQYWTLEPLHGQLKACAEPAQPAENFWSHRAFHYGLDALDKRIPCVDIDTGIAIGEGAFGRHC